jgi:hypothetical protein
MFGMELDFATDNPALLTDTDLVDAVIGYERMAAWATARQFAVLAEFHRRGESTGNAGTSVLRQWAADEVALAVTASPGSATRRLAHADRLDGPLRATRDLLAAGRICAARARLICDRTTVLDDTTATAVQDRVLPDAPSQTWAQLNAALRRAILAVDADGAAARHRTAKAQRRVEVFAGEDGMASLWAKLTAPDATAAFGWITRLARGMNTTTDGGDPVADPRSIDQRRADVLVALLTGNLIITDTAAPDAATSATGTGVGNDPGASTGPDNGSETGAGNRRRPVYVKPVGANRPLVHLTMPLSTMTGADDEPCELTGYGPIPAHLARDLAAQAGAVWRRIVTDPLSGTVLDVGRTTYRPPAALTDLVRARDMTCRNPRCRQPATTCELDHVVEWQNDGVTAEHNLCALCVRHHDLKEAPGWQVVLHDDRHLEWITPTGHRYRSRPHDHRPTRAAPPPSPVDEADASPPF